MGDSVRQMSRTDNEKIKVTYSSVLGTALAVVLSWTKWHSIGWAIWHGLCSWFYVIYYVCKGY